MAQMELEEELNQLWADDEVDVRPSMMPIARNSMPKHSKTRSDVLIRDRDHTR